MLGWELPPNFVGGMGMVCDQLTRQLAKDGADIEFILPFSADYSTVKHMKVLAASEQDATTLMKSGSTYDSFMYQVRYKNGKKVVRTLQDQVEAFADDVGHFVEYGRYDVIHAHDWLTLKAGIRAKQKTGLPLFVHIHATEYDRSGGRSGNPVVREIESTGLHMADHIFAVSQITKDSIIREYGIPADKIEVIHNSIDRSWYDSLDDGNSYHYLEAMKKYGYRVVVNVGRLTIQKGLTNLLVAAKDVVARAPKTIFLIVGSGEQYGELMELAADLGISSNVLFAGFHNGKKWRDAFAVADLFVMPSVSEPFGITPYEAIGYGTPALISKQSGIAEVLTNCIKVDYWDTNEIANQIVSVVQNDALRDELHRQGYLEYQKLSWSNASEKIVNSYNKHAQYVGARS